MGFEVRVQVTLKKSPNEHVMEGLDHVFGTAHHEPGSKVVTITEHVSVADEADAVAFVRGLVLEAVPAGATITDISARSD